MSYNTTTLMICLIVMLYLFYQPRLYLFYSLFAIFNWLLFLYLAQKNGALLQMNTEINGVPVITGLIVLREFYVMIVMIVIMLVAYRSIPDTLKFEKKVTDQTEQLQKNAESRLKMTGIISEKVDVLFDKVNTQNELIVQFNQKMETQSVSFAEMSATMEELAGAAEQIATESVRQIDGNVKMEAIVEEFKNIQVETKKNLDETYADIQSVSDKSSMANERLMDVEKTVVSIREQSDRIAETVNLIVDIADKINLLSLNASIEAARAGEAGRGFAVVADEIGKLAYQTQESIKVIESVLSASSRNTVDGVAVIQGTAGMVRDMISHMKESANKVQTLQESIFIEEKYIRIIISQMTENISLSKRIGSATDEQKVAVETTSKALENLIEILNEMVGELKELAQLAKDIYENADDVKVDTAKALNG
jgi:methyl-accepting chemotaxis protein